jgi:MFS family permease
MPIMVLHMAKSVERQGTVTATAVTSEQVDTEGGNWWVLVAIGTGSLMSRLDSSISNTVLPVISRALQADVAAVEWVVAIYLLVLSGLVLIFGRLSDMLGHRRVYLGGFGLFVLGSGACAFAPSVEWLIAFRAVQGRGAAMLTASSPFSPTPSPRAAADACLACKRRRSTSASPSDPRSGAGWRRRSGGAPCSS